MGSEVEGRELVACANAACRVRSRTLRKLAEDPESRQYWPEGLCPSCRDPQDLEETLELLERDRRRAAWEAEVRHEARRRAREWEARRHG